MKIRLAVTEGPLQGEAFVFDSHDMFVFGRAEDAHCRITDDPYVSRHHLMLEVNPPQVHVRDLGSLNGFRVNGTQYGGRRPGHSSDTTGTDLQHGDRIQVGETVFALTFDPPPPVSPTPPVGSSSFVRAQTESVPLPAPRRMTHSSLTCSLCGAAITDPAEPAEAHTHLCRRCESARTTPPHKRMLAAISHTPAPAAEQNAPPPLPPRDAPWIEGYRMDKLLGKGGMGAVYLATCEDSGASVAVKVLDPQGVYDEESQMAFEREVRVTKHLHHPNIVAFYDQGYTAGRFYLILEYVAGGNVDDLMDRRGGRIPLAEAIPILTGALDGLAHAHAKGFVHRDLKPANILLDGTEGIWAPKISDFGLSKNFQLAGMSGLTCTGDVGGTPIYMPPEQITQYKYVYPASDIFSIGATFYALLTGNIIYDRLPEGDALPLVLDGTIVPIRERLPDLPPAVAAVIDRALQRDKHDRYEHGGAMRDALRAALQSVHS